MDDLKLFIQEELKTLVFKKVDFDESLVKSKLLDSITVVDLLVSIEEKTGKTIPQHLINEEYIDNINKIVNTINSI